MREENSTRAYYLLTSTYFCMQYRFSMNPGSTGSFIQRSYRAIMRSHFHYTFCSPACSPTDWTACKECALAIQYILLCASRCARGSAPGSELDHLSRAHPSHRSPAAPAATSVDALRTAKRTRRLEEAHEVECEVEQGGQPRSRSSSQPHDRSDGSHSCPRHR